MGETIERAPAEVFPLAEFIYDEMQARGWKTADVALRMGWTTEEEFGIDQLSLELLLVIQDDGVLIGDELFRKIACAFGVSEEFFRHLDAMWKKWPAKRSIFVCPEDVLSGATPP